MLHSAFGQKIINKQIKSKKRKLVLKKPGPTCLSSSRGDDALLVAASSLTCGLAQRAAGPSCVSGALPRGPGCLLGLPRAAGPVRRATKDCSNSDRVGPCGCAASAVGDSPGEPTTPATPERAGQRGSAWTRRPPQPEDRGGAFPSAWRRLSSRLRLPAVQVRMSFFSFRAASSRPFWQFTRFLVPGDFSLSPTRFACVSIGLGEA
jgi:hypothetical protein